MKIIVNISTLSPPLSGVGRYTLELIRYLLKHQEIEDIVGFSFGTIKTTNELNELIIKQQQSPFTAQSKSWQSAIKLQLKSKIKLIPFARTIKCYLQNKLIKRQIEQYKDYIYWEPNYILSEFNGLSIPTIYDLSYIRFPQFHPKTRLQWLDKCMPGSLAKAKHIITISEFSKQEIIDIYKLTEDKISIISPAVSKEFRIDYQKTEIEKIKLKYQLPPYYILSVGNIEPRKNIEGLLNAYEQLSRQHKKQYPLVLIGAKGWLNKEIEKKIQQIQETTRIIRLGYIPQAELPIIYQGASLFIYISLYEGFGMPIAEAMASSIPVICSNSGPMPAVANGCAKLVDPNNIEEISSTIASLLEDKTMQEKLVAKGLLISKNYTWEKSTEQLIAVLKEVEIKRSLPK